MSTLASIAHVVLAMLLAPLLPGVINRVKAWFAGRRGPPLLQAYYDLWKLLHKGAVYSTTTTWVFVAGPIVGLACVATALLIVPLGGVPGLLAFSGDFLLVAYLLGLMRFFTILAALDTGSSFEGMGASREAFYSALAEPALLLGLAAMAAQSHSLSLSAMYAAVTRSAMTSFAGPALLLVAAALLIVFLAENARIPIDDPNTHLELTMIHEVMVLGSRRSRPGHDPVRGHAQAVGARRAAGRHSRARAERMVGRRSGRRHGRHDGPGRVGRRDRIDDRPAAAGARAAVPGRGIGAVDPGPGARDEVMRESLA